MAITYPVCRSTFQQSLIGSQDAPDHMLSRADAAMQIVTAEPFL